MLNKTLLGSAAVIMTMVGAQAADLPSKKAAPATYVKICDAYGAGFFFIPGSDTCVKLGGYVRAEYNYTPAQDTYLLRGVNILAANTPGTGMMLNSGRVVGGGANAAGGASANGGILQTPAAILSATSYNATVYQPKALQDTTGYETRGRIEVDARTPTSMGVARTFIRLRAANTSGIRNTTIGNALGYANASGSTTGITVEAASVQWAGVTFGIAPENYAMMPSMMYGSTPWTGFPNGMKQIGYTATLGGGFSASLALEDHADHAGGANVTANPSTQPVIVGNVRLDQSWGFGAVHGLFQNNNNYQWSQVAAATGAAVLYSERTSGSWGMQTTTGANTEVYDTKNRSAYAIGATVSFKLPMIAAGDQIWFTANYADGAIGMLLSGGGLSNVSTAANHRMIGGLVRADSNVAVVDGARATNTLGNVKGWNVATAFTHYWTSNWRSNFAAGYVEINPPTYTGADQALVWGKGQLYTLAGSVIYSPAKNFDIGLEVHYANVQNKLQNATANAGNTAAYNEVVDGLKGSNWATKLRVERSF